jgi:hypothetical protein
VRKRSLFLLVAVFGLLPFWISMVVLLVGVAEHGHSGEYAAAAGWYPLMGALLSGYTLVVAILTVLVHEAVRGDAARKRRIALMGWPYYRQAQDDRYNDEQKARVLEFMRSSDAVHKMMPEPFDVSIEGGSGGRDGRLWRFGVRIKPSNGSSTDQEPIYAIVDVLNQGPTIRCFTRLSSGKRDSSYPCREAIPTEEAGS